jgi:signal recognition particle subunit SRP54
LEADVNFKVVKSFIEQVKVKAIGQEVLRSLTPGQQMIKIVRDELTHLMEPGGIEDHIKPSETPYCIFLVGIQGSGKTTTAAKLALKYKGKGFNPLLVATDIKRPAAEEQLEILARQTGIAVYRRPGNEDPIAICHQALQTARLNKNNLIIVDTAGRFHIDEELMVELIELKRQVNPQETLLVADATTGQEAVNIASTFNERLGIDGIILTKTDGDARGGAALSMKTVTGKPIKFIGSGEKPDALEVFYPDRMASRLLGMGDILTLIEKTEAAISHEQAKEVEKKILEHGFTLEDFREQLRQIKNMGPLDQIISMIPGMNRMKGLHVEEKELIKIEAIINSMTPQERRNYTIIDGSRRRRIAAGSGTTIQDVNRLLKQFAHTRKLMKKFMRPGKKARGNLLNLLR